MNASVKRRGAHMIGLWKSIPASSFVLPIAVVILQTACPLLIRHTRKPTLHAQSAAPLYHPASVTLVAEVAKCFVAFTFMYQDLRKHYQHYNQQGNLIAKAGRAIIADTCRLNALLLPASLYFASNITAMYALSYLRSYMFSAIMNVRIVFAALLSVLFLDKRISEEQWKAIIIVVCASTVLSMETAEESEGFIMTGETIGVLIAICTAAESAAGGVFMEKYLAQQSFLSFRSTDAAANLGTKHDSDIVVLPVMPSARSVLWQQQGVLALYSTVFAGLYAHVFLHDVLSTRGLLAGWTPSTVFIMLLQALQGILVACTIQEWGIVSRLILGTISICISILVETLLFSENMKIREFFGIIMAIVGSNLYFTMKRVNK